jgi:hypothetical protein
LIVARVVEELFVSAKAAGIQHSCAILRERGEA